MTIFSAYNLSKSHDSGSLFEAISFGISSGEHIGLIGRNGIGKTTLMNIIASKEVPDTGDVVFNSQATFEYLEQFPSFDSFDNTLLATMKGKSKVMEMLDEHSQLCELLNKKYSSEIEQRVNYLNQVIDHDDGWNLENQAKKFLSKLGIEDYYKSVSELSGGMKKRVALARALLTDPDLLILDEPTNHLDADSVQWLQDRLMNSSKSIFFVTHDRYFLDSVSNRIIELDQKKLFFYTGNYEEYLIQKDSLVQSQKAEVAHIRSKLRMELAWLQRGVKARRTKQASRKEWIEELVKQTKLTREKDIKIELGKTFLGKTIIEAHYIGKSIGDVLLFDDFTYIAKPGDRIGIIGPNGSGKSTLLNILAGEVKVSSGLINIGQSVNIGYFKQDLSDLKENITVTESLREIAEFIDVGEGRHRYLTVRDLLNRFMFTGKQQNSLVSSLSGGELRRLGLLRVFMKNPNILFLDEPTNDLDIQTLTTIEDYLDDFYGVLLVVSHDRAFLDRMVDTIWAFDGNGNIKEFPGNYSSYLEKKEQIDANSVNEKKFDRSSKVNEQKPNQKKKKLSYKEQIEFDTLESEITILELRKSEVEKLLSLGMEIDYKELEQLSIELELIEKDLDSKTIRWLELSEYTNA